MLELCLWVSGYVQVHQLVYFCCFVGEHVCAGVYCISVRVFVCIHVRALVRYEGQFIPMPKNMSNNEHD